jgi:cytoskeletal protein CcmA (bactofilin family)
MSELTEIRFNEQHVLLKNNLVKSAILPEKAGELGRNITIQGDTVIEGAVYANKLDIQQGSLEIKGAVFTQLELYVSSQATGDIQFKKSVASADAIVSRATECNLQFYSDINAKTVTLQNAFVAGSIYADEIVLEHCVVIGGVFASNTAELTDCIVGTFSCQSMHAAQQLILLLPSAFSTERISLIPGTKLFNLSLADLGALYAERKPAANSGKIEMDTDADEITTILSDTTMQKTIRSYSVAGKVLAADLLDTDKFQNHFLLSAASLGSQLLQNYHLKVDDDAQSIPVTFARLKEFFFKILCGQIEIAEINGSFNIADITNSLR